MKLLKRLILFSLACELDFFIKNEGFEYKQYIYFYKRLSFYNQSSIRDAVLQLVTSGEVDKIVRNKTPFFRLTSQGRERLLTFFPINTGQKKVWDRVWRIAILNSGSQSEKTKKIRRLRAGLRDIGFKKLSRGVYISPLPINDKLREFLLEGKLTALITVIESRNLLIGDDKQLAYHIWQLDRLEKKYNDLVNIIESFLLETKKIETQTGLDNKKLTLITNNFFKILEEDPGLPKKILPADWPAERVKEKFLFLMEKLKQLEKI